MIMTKKKLLEKLYEEQENFTKLLSKYFPSLTENEKKEFIACYSSPENSVKMVEKMGKQPALRAMCCEQPALRAALRAMCCGTGEMIVAAVIAGIVDPKKCEGVAIYPKIAEICRERLKPYGVPAENIHEADEDIRDKALSLLLSGDL